MTTGSRTRTIVKSKAQNNETSQVNRVIPQQRMDTLGREDQTQPSWIFP